MDQTITLKGFISLLHLWQEHFHFQLSEQKFSQLQNLLLNNETLDDSGNEKDKWTSFGNHNFSQLKELINSFWGIALLIQSSNDSRSLQQNSSIKYFMATSQQQTNTQENYCKKELYPRFLWLRNLHPTKI
jgi:hypothetical protein